MSTEPFEPYGTPHQNFSEVPAAAVAPVAPTAPPRRRRRGPLIAASVAATAGLAAVALGVGIGLNAGAASTTSAQSPSISESVLPSYHRGDGSGSSSFGSHSYGGSQLPSLGTPSDTSTSTTTAATAEQASGIALIDTVLSYQGAEAAGTGVVLTSDGKILTNNHVVDGSTSITVTIASTGASYSAQVIGTDPSADVAVLQLAGASGLTPANIDASSSVAVGDTVTGVGNAQGGGTLTSAAGTVTALGQTITATDENGSNPETLNGLIQDDAAIEPGDSGGPLYDADGEVIGIDTAASSGTGAAEGYAIPIETALQTAEDIVSGNNTDSITLGYPAFLGVAVSPDETTAGALISGVVSDGPAAAIGLVEGDVITAVDGASVASADALTQLLSGYAPGAQVTIDWTAADGSAQTAVATLIAGPAN